MGGEGNEDGLRDNDSTNITPPSVHFLLFTLRLLHKTLNYCQSKTKKHSNTTQAYLHIHDDYVPEIIAKGTRTLAVLGFQFALRNFFYTNFDNQAHKLRANRHPRENLTLQNLT